MTLPFRLLLVTDWSLGDGELLARTADALSVSPQVAVQHRNPGASGRTFYDQALQLRELCTKFHSALFINSRVDIALDLDAHVHLTSTSPLVADVRRALRAHQLVSAVVHSGADIDNANAADVAIVSPVFTAGSKVNDTRPALGPDGFLAFKNQLKVPAFALGGLTPETARDVHGADGFAAINGLLRARDVAQATREFLSCFRGE